MSVIDEYLEKVNGPQKDELERIRRIVKQAVPEAEEVISYGVPTLKYKGKYLIHFAAFKNHLSLFPGSGAITALGDKLEGFTASKGTIQFTPDKPLPASIIKEIIATRLASISKG